MLAVVLANRLPLPFVIVVGRGIVNFQPALMLFFGSYATMDGHEFVAVLS